MTDIDLKVLNLKELFRKDDPLIERHHAATKIISAVRRYLARNRYDYYKRGLREWKLNKCLNILVLIHIFKNLIEILIIKSLIIKILDCCSLRQ